MAYEFHLPDLGEGVTEGEIAEWLVKVGDTIAEDDPMVEVETDKATVEIPSPVDGVVAALHADAGDRVPVGALLITLQADDEPPASAAQPAAIGDGAAPRDGGLRATPGARRAAKELGIELATLNGSGPDGAVTEPDVRSATVGVAAPVAVGGRREPLRGVRRRIAERLTQSHQEVPKVTVVEECDFTELSRARGELSFVPFVVKAVISGLKESRTSTRRSRVTTSFTSTATPSASPHKAARGSSCPCSTAPTPARSGSWTPRSSGSRRRCATTRSHARSSAAARSR
jgi:pyruvate/2-oxoglutarate dehydrogenase complex dihydrolipoamide acyltransferase (E2) component